MKHVVECGCAYDDQKDGIFWCDLHREAGTVRAERMNLLLQNQELQKEVALLRRGRTCEECESSATGMDGYVCFPCWNKANLQIDDWRKVLADLALHNCCDEVCFDPCSTERAANALKKYEIEERRVVPQQNNNGCGCNLALSRGHRNDCPRRMEPEQACPHCLTLPRQKASGCSCACHTFEG